MTKVVTITITVFFNLILLSFVTMSILIGFLSIDEGFQNHKLSPVIAGGFMTTMFIREAICIGRAYWQYKRK